MTGYAKPTVECGELYRFAANPPYNFEPVCPAA